MHEIANALSIDVEDYFQGPGRTMFFRLHEKNGKELEIPAHFRAVAYLDAYMAAAVTTARPPIDAPTSTTRFAPWARSQRAAASTSSSRLAAA